MRRRRKDSPISPSIVFIWPKDLKKQARLGAGATVMSVTEVSEYLRVHRATIYNMIKSDQIPHFRIGGKYRFDRATLDTWMNRGY